MRSLNNIAEIFSVFNSDVRATCGFNFGNISTERSTENFFYEDAIVRGGNLHFAIFYFFQMNFLKTQLKLR